MIQQSSSEPIFSSLPPKGYERVHGEISSGKRYSISSHGLGIVAESGRVYYADGSHTQVQATGEVRDIAVDDDIYLLTNQQVRRFSKFGSKKRVNTELTGGVRCSISATTGRLVVLTSAGQLATVDTDKNRLLVHEETVDVSFLNLSADLSLLTTDNWSIVADDTFCYCYPYEHESGTSETEWSVSYKGPQEVISDIGVVGESLVVATNTRVEFFDLRTGERRTQSDTTCNWIDGTGDEVLLASGENGYALVHENGTVQPIGVSDDKTIAGSSDFQNIYIDDGTEGRLYHRTDTATGYVNTSALSGTTEEMLQFTVYNTTPRRETRQIELEMSTSSSKDQKPINLRTVSSEITLDPLSATTAELGDISFKQLVSDVEIECVADGTELFRERVPVDYNIQEEDITLEVDTEIEEYDSQNLRLKLRLENNGKVPIELLDPESGKISNTFAPGEQDTAEKTVSPPFPRTLSLTYRGPGGPQRTKEIEVSLPEEACEITGEMKSPGNVHIVVDNPHELKLRESVTVRFEEIEQEFQETIQIGPQGKTYIWVQFPESALQPFQEPTASLSSPSSVLPDTELRFEQYNPIETERRYTLSDGQTTETLVTPAEGQVITETVDVRNASDARLGTFQFDEDLTLPIMGPEESVTVSRSVALFEPGTVPVPTVSKEQNQVELAEVDVAELHTPDVVVRASLEIAKRANTFRYKVRNTTSDGIRINRLAVGEDTEFEPENSAVDSESSAEFERELDELDVTESDSPILVSVEYSFISQSKKQSSVQSLALVAEVPYLSKAVDIHNVTESGGGVLSSRKLVVEFDSTADVALKRRRYTAKGQNGNTLKTTPGKQRGFHIRVRNPKRMSPIAAEVISEADDGQITEVFELERSGRFRRRNSWNIERKNVDSNIRDPSTSVEFPSVLTTEWQILD